MHLEIFRARERDLGSARRKGDKFDVVFPRAEDMDFVFVGLYVVLVYIISG